MCLPLPLMDDPKKLLIDQSTSFFSISRTTAVSLLVRRKCFIPSIVKFVYVKRECYERVISTFGNKIVFLHKKKNLL